MATEIQTAGRVDTTLYDIETTLLALIEVDSDDLTPELRAQYEKELEHAIRTSVEKRERVAIKLFDLGQRAFVKRAAAKAHMDRAIELNRSADSFERDADKLKEYVLRVMAELPKPKKGVRTLEGTSATFKAKAVADSVEVYDEAMIPDSCKRVTVKMELREWQKLLKAAGWVNHEGITVAVDVVKADVKVELQKNSECLVCGSHSVMSVGLDPALPCHECNGMGIVPAKVPGAHLKTNKLRLEVS